MRLSGFEKTAMIQQIFEALKSIGIEDMKVLDVVVAIEERHRRHDERFSAIEKDLTLLKWMAGGSIPLIVLTLGATMAVLFRLAGNVR